MKVLVTGGSGFIGTHVMEELLSRGHEVKVFDRRVPKSDRVEWLDGDLRWLGDCDRAVRGADAIIHLAARISVDESLEYIWQYFNDNLMSTVNLFLAAAKNGVNRIVFTSSCEVYGETPEKGATEEAACNPTSPYAASKYAAERAALSFKRVHPELKLAVMRPFNSILADQLAPVFNDRHLRIDTISELVPGRQYTVPCFDEDSFEMRLGKGTLIAEPATQKDAYEIATKYGRTVKVTGDHSVFKWSHRNLSNKNGRLVATPVRELEVGDRIAIPTKLPCIERDIKSISLKMDDREEVDIPVSDDLLWLLGFYAADGSATYYSKGVVVAFSSDEHLLRRAKAILDRMGIASHHRAATRGRSPALRAGSSVLSGILSLLGFMDEEIPNWVIQLPLTRLKFFLEGFREGDGTHAWRGRRASVDPKMTMSFTTSSQKVAERLNYILMRFGALASMNRYLTTFKQRYGDRKSPLYRISVSGLPEGASILDWDEGTNQKTSAHKIGDLALVGIERISKCSMSDFVYDFSVPGGENFVGGTGISCHNTFGEWQKPYRAGAVIPTFILQALKGGNLKVHGSGDQVRDFVYVKDIAKAHVDVLEKEGEGIFNVATGQARSINSVAEFILKATGKARIEHVPDVRKEAQLRYSVGDSERIRRAIGWKPASEFEPTLSRVIKWYESNSRPTSTT
jgi:nucleoside-diphosphate-sugar epimerase/intein/homing endonuclease